MTPEQRLSVAVIHRAVLDFLSAEHPDDLSRRIRSVYAKIDAGAFLLEQDDAIKRHWFTLAKVEPQAFRYREAWTRRLAGLRYLHSKLVRRYNSHLKVAA